MPTAALKIPAEARNIVNPRWLAERIFAGLWQLGYVDRGHTSKALGQSTASLSLTMDDPSAKNGKREFLITVEEL